MPSYFVYVIVSDRTGRLYVGMSADVKARISEHNRGQTKSTKGYRPWRLVFVEEFPDRIEARKREKYLKGGSGKELIKRRLLVAQLDTCLPAGREQLPSKQ
jgi:putative endonuclease